MSLGLVPNHHEFNDTSYLIAKNGIDARSYNTRVFENLKRVIASRITFKQTSISNSNSNSNSNSYSNSNSNHFVVVDIGAGLLPLLARISDAISDTNDGSKSQTVMKYIAFESNGNLIPTIEQRLLSSSFVKLNDSSSNISTYVRYQASS